MEGFEDGVKTDWKNSLKIVAMPRSLDSLLQSKERDEGREDCLVNERRYLYIRLLFLEAKSLTSLDSYATFDEVILDDSSCSAAIRDITLLTVGSNHKEGRASAPLSALA